MNEYVLNEIALNADPGYLQYGAGSASIVISATGDVRVNAQVFATATAALAIPMTGQGRLAAIGASAAPLSIVSVGDSSDVSLGASAMDLIIDMAGFDAVVSKASSEANIILDGLATPKIFPCSFGHATIMVSGKYDIPDVQVIPGAYSATHRSRSMAVASEPRTVIVPQDPPQIVRESRASRIQQQGRQAS